jgi:hypothetical protein
MPKKNARPGRQSRRACVGVKRSPSKSSLESTWSVRRSHDRQGFTRAAPGDRGGDERGRSVVRLLPIPDDGPSGDGSMAPCRRLCLAFVGEREAGFSGGRGHALLPAPSGVSLGVWAW